MFFNESYTIGHGYDAHRFEKGRKLIIGGVEIENDVGLAGHSDADVLTHAVCDALLGAAALGDLGRHFPDSDPEYKDICSLVLLERCRKMLADRNLCIANIDATIIAQTPKMSPYIPKMIESFSKILVLPQNKINIKATTEEGMGFTGRKEGIAAHAVALVYEKPSTYVFV